MDKMEIITKESAIKAFRNGCNYLENLKMRESAVGYQNIRSAWDIYNKYFGLIRIQEEHPIYTIKVYPLIKIGLTESEFNLTNDEYKELKDLYFGEFQQDMEYFNRWSEK